MKWNSLLGGGLAVLLAGPVVAQELPPPRPAAPIPTQPMEAPVAEEIRAPVANPGPTTTTDAATGPGLESESLPRELAEDLYQGAPSTLGPTAVSDVRFLMDRLGLANVLGDDSHLRAFGWTEAGYNGASTGAGLLSVQPRQNRFGNEFLLNQIGIVLQRPLQQDRFDVGFNIRYFAGADAALGAAKGGVGYPVSNGHFGQDFRDLYISAHLPILTEGGVDLKAGRMNTIIGYNGFLSPYRPFYSSDYQFFYSQDGAFTGILADLHATKKLDVWNGVTFGANTFFTKRSNNSICYIGQVNYWVTDEHRTRLTGSVYCGQNAIFAAPGLAGNFDTTLEFRIQQNWGQRFTQIVQSNMGWDPNSAVGLGSWYGVYTIGLFHLNPKLDINVRGEWFDDVRGTRTGINTDYSEVTLGLNWHPIKCLEFRPEIRGDFAGENAFGRNGAHTERSQLTGGISVLVKF